MTMPRFLCAILCFAFAASTLMCAERAPDTARAATPDELSMLAVAIEKTAKDLGRWAYTETTKMQDEKGKTKGETIVRFDPSKRYDEQWTPIQVNGHPPTDKDVAKYRKRGEETRRRDENQTPDPRQSLGELIQLERSNITSENERHFVFEVPLRKQNNIRFPPEKFLVLARLNRENKLIENISVQLRDSFRVKLVAKVKSGEGSLDFETVDPKFAPTLKTVRGTASVSILFVSVGGTFDLNRKDFKHVTPYADRFGVQIGPLKALDF